MTGEIDLIVPMKSPRNGKTRLRDGAAVSAGHIDLVLAMAADTLAAARECSRVRSLLVVTTDPPALAPLSGLGASLLDEGTAGGLNPAISRGEHELRSTRPDGVVGVLQPDLPALRTAELDAALTEAADRRAFVADRGGTGTTLLLAGTARGLRPCFGERSACAHAESGAVALTTPAPTLRGDVDTTGDLARARDLGLGEYTRRLVDNESVLC